MPFVLSMGLHLWFSLYFSRKEAVETLVFNLFSTMLPLSNCPLFQAPMTLNKL